MPLKARFLAVIVLSLFFMAGVCPPLFAASKSVTVQVSCVVPATLELASGTTAGSTATSTQASPSPAEATPPQRPELGFQTNSTEVSVQTNLDGNYQITQTRAKAGNTDTKLFTLTVI